MNKRNPKAQKRRTLAPEIRELAEVYYMSLDCPRSLTLTILLRYDEFDQVASLKAKPIDYADAVSYHRSALASDLLRKYPGLPVKVDPEAEAKKSWYQSENECKLTNVKMLTGIVPELRLILDVASDFVAEVLGPCPLDLSPRFGPGATVSDTAEATTVLDKVSSRPTITDGARCILSLWDGTAWERSQSDFDGYKHGSSRICSVEGNHFFTVLKTALTHRGCAKGPSINVAYQLAVGREIRGRFKSSISLDLSAGQRVHNKLALLGSLYGIYATLDSERASDTMAYSVVSILLSKSGMWPELLKTLREPQTFIEKKWVSLEKFSAMGNGFTFELETLIFLSICYAVAWAIGEENFPSEYSGLSPMDLVRIGHISVYGDDVVIPTFMASDVMAVLSQLGFTVNRNKSYKDGPFRESCGGDYYDGVNVNTYKITEEPSAPAHWFSIHNGLYARYTTRYPSDLYVKKLLSVVKNQLPREYRDMYGPTFLGDLVLHGWYNHRIRAHAHLVKGSDGSKTPDPNQWVGRLRCLAPRIERARFTDYSMTAQLAHFLYTAKSDQPARRPTRRRPIRYEVSHWEGDYYVAHLDYVPKAPRWLSSSPYARFFGLTEDGSYVA